METIRIDPLIAWLLRSALALLFAAAAFHKLRDPRAFQRTLGDYEILPPTLVKPGAIGLVAAEIALVIALLFPSRDVSGASVGLAAMSLLALYTAAIGLNLRRGRSEIDCGCLGPAYRQSLSTGLILRNALLGAGAALIALPVSQRSLHPIDAVSLIGGLCVLVLLFHAVNLLVAQAGLWTDRENAS